MLSLLSSKNQHRLLWVTLVAIAVLLFSVVFLPHYTAKVPLHVDSWLIVSLADRSLKVNSYDFPEPFTNQKWDYPPGLLVIQSVVTRITGIPLHILTILFPALLFLTAGFLNYAIAREMGSRKGVAILAFLFTPLILSNITMLGLYYAVPLALGSVFFLLFALFITKRMYLCTLVVYLALLLVHRSTFLLATLLLFFSFMYGLLFERKAIILIIVSVLLGSTILFVGLYYIIFHTLQLSQLNLILFKSELILLFTRVGISALEQPYIVYITLMTPLFLFFLGVGYFMFLNKGNPLQIPLAILFALLIFDYFVFLRYGHGYIFLYRRLSFYIFLLTPLFVGFGVYYSAEFIYRLLHKRLHIKRMIVLPLLALAVLALFIYSIKLNVEAHPSPIWVTPEEFQFFQEFGKQHPGSYLLTDHLEAYSLPYFNLKPVMTSPGHLGGSLNFDELYIPYTRRDVSVLATFFNTHTDYDGYVYYAGTFDTPYFKEVFRQGDLVIYQYQKNQPT